MIRNAYWATFYLLIFRAGTIAGIMLIPFVIVVPITYSAKRGDADTETKNWELRRVPLIPNARAVFQRMRSERSLSFTVVSREPETTV